MATTLTILVENTVPGKADGLIGEHGFSLFLERPDRRILFDTGAGAALLHNAARLGKDLRTTDAIVLSHGHKDHTGGLVAALGAIGKRIPVYGHPGIFADRFGKRANGEVQYAGLPFKREALEGMGATFDLAPAFREIAPGVHLTGEVPRRSSYETGDDRLFIPHGDTVERDPFRDDLSMVVEGADGLTLILGCCHSGLINTLDHVCDRLPGKPIHTVIGGTHLGFAPAEQLRQTIATLRERRVRRLGLSHCTGLEAGAKLAREFGDAVAFCNVGYSLTLD
jgi:7,8-dihydropterin-6-yl-methyl-4-(beta-D-ribofuranosyl)aminobenzene 5'-phosphate synthase